jgi:hypothetical protein
MLMTIGGLIAAFLLLGVARWMKKRWLRDFVLGGVAVWSAFYAVMLLTASFSSKEATLGLNEPKEFCGFYLDCHMHTAVTGVRRTKTIGDSAAQGEFYVVRVKVFSDAKQATLGLLTVDARVLDESGQEFLRDARAESRLGEQPPLDKRISPVESFEREIVFDLPAGVNNPRLDIREGYGIDHAIESVLIGDEDSILHKRRLFKLEEQNQTAAVQ